MPFDALTDPAAVELPPKPARWPRTPNKQEVLRPSLDLSDTAVVWLLLARLKYDPASWARGVYWTHDAACLVGWMQNYTETTNKPVWWNAQSKRVLRLIHDALPRSAQRPYAVLHEVIGRYNDTHGHPAIIRVLERAYARAKAAETA